MLTTCARDYVTWRNELAGGRRARSTASRCVGFPSPRERVPRISGVVSHRGLPAPALGEGRTRLARGRRTDEPGAGAYLASASHDYVFFFSARYYHAFHGARAVSRKAILVPTAERDPAVAVSIFGPVFRGVRAVMYNSFEERAMIHALAGQPRGPRRRRRDRLGRAGAHRPAARPPQVPPGRPLRDLRRPDRREQGLQGAVLVLRTLRRSAMRRDLSLVLVGNSHPADPRTPASSGTWGSSTTATSSTSSPAPRR